MASEALWTSHPPSEMDQNGGTRLWRFLRAMSGLILGVYVIRVLDSIFSSCQILLTFQSCVAQLSIIFSLPRVSCTSKGRFFFLFWHAAAAASWEMCFIQTWLLISLIEAWNRCTVFTFFFFLSEGKKIWGKTLHVCRKKALYHREMCFLSFVSVLTFWSKYVESIGIQLLLPLLVSFLTTNGPYSSICWNEDEICRTRTRILLPVASRACVCVGYAFSFPHLTH